MLGAGWVERFGVFSRAQEDIALSSIKCPQCGFVTRAGATKCKGCGASLDSSHPSTLPSDHGQSQPDDIAEPSRREIRRAGLKKIKAGAGVTIVFVGVLTFIVVSGSTITRVNPILLVLGLVPVAWLLAGVLQIVTGVSFENLSDKWNGLAGWQRGLIGVSVFVAGLVVLAIVCLIIMFVLDWMSGTSRPLF